MAGASFMLALGLFFASRIIFANGAEPTRVVIGENGSLTCNTPTEEMWWSVNGKNISKGSNKR